MFGKILDYQVNENIIKIDFEKQTGYVKVISSQIIQLYEEKMSSFKVEISQKAFSNFETWFDGKFLDIKTEDYLF